MGIHEAYTQLMYRLFELYGDREAANIADLVTEHITGFKRIDRITNKQFPLNNGQQRLLAEYTALLLQHTPVQYVLKEAWFAGLPFYVDEHVLIPRPETEELVEWVLRVCEKSIVRSESLLDIGTGSGCIPVSIKKKLTALEVFALDISTGALGVAKHNAQKFNTPIHFYEEDILDETTWSALPMFDIIVSNPPYIKASEEQEMSNNVIRHEPRQALFVPDDDALVFYTAVARFGLTHLNNNGKLFFEINEALGREVKQLLEKYGYTNIECRKDMQQKDRMVKASMP